jgi:hypothetical protein
MEAVIKRVNREKKEVRFENEIVIFEMSLEWSMDNHMKDSKKNPHIPVPIICHWNLEC